MAIQTYADLKAAVATYLNRANLTARIPEVIAMTESRIAYGDRNPQMVCEPLRIRAMEASADITISAQTAALPTGFLATRRLYLSGSPIIKPNFVPPDIFWERWISSTSGRPTDYTIEGENFVFGPTPDAAYTGKSLYYKKFTALSADGDTNWLLTNAPGVYLHGALAEAYFYARNSAKALEELALYSGLVNALNAADKSDRFASPWQAVSDTGNP